eukprot:6092236-Ditylum_brightwellii.AAC.1
MSEWENKASIRVTYSKGDEICFFNGQYKGSDGREKATSVSVWSCAKHHPPKSTNCMEAVFMQKPSVEKLTKKLAKELSVLGATNKKSRMESIIKRIDEEIFGSRQYL